MKNTIFLSFLTLSSAFAETLHHPIQDQASASAVELAPIGLVKVKIFPHDGAYSNPQGAESRMDVAQVKSEGSCTLTTPSGTSRGEGVVVLKAQDFLSGPGAIECDSPMTLEREGATAISYRGTFTLHHVNGKLVVVNVVTFNDYLKGVVPSEMSYKWPLEALKAQTIAARTYAANQILQSRKSNPQAFFDLDDTVSYQAYRGLTVERESTSAAVEATDEVYLLDQKGKSIVAYFSADSGGHTETAANAWGVKPLSYTPSKPEVYDLRLVKSAWTVSFTLAEINEKLIARGVVPKDFKLTRFEINGYTKAARVKKVKLYSDEKGMIEIPGERFRYGLALRSSRFKVSETEVFKFDGQGWGHGVGMNQSGAKALVESLGWDHKQVLEFYYEGIQL